MLIDGPHNNILTLTLGLEAIVGGESKLPDLTRIF